eukprot:Tamp_22634.p1 GENE.Tamp_22634~~Tamp_22634.p1  ORF type:complete len:323 (-),score=31.56 Tamp_22634:108-941(-)
MWPAMYQNWGYYGPMLAAHDGSFHSGKRKRQNISDACTSCRRSKVKCDEEKPCRRCVKHGRAAACASWREDAAKASPQNKTDDQSKPQRGDPAKSRVRTARPPLPAARPSLPAAALQDFALSTPTEPETKIVLGRFVGGGGAFGASGSKKGVKRRSTGVARNSLARTDAACSWTDTSNILSGVTDARQPLMASIAPAHRPVEASDSYLDDATGDFFGGPFVREGSPFSASETTCLSRTDSESDVLFNDADDFLATSTSDAASAFISADESIGSWMVA